MRAFIVLCLTAVAVAAPQGYNYQAGGGAGGLQQTGAGGFAGSFGAVSSGSTTGSAGFFQQGGHSGAGQSGFFSQTSHGGAVSHHQQQQHHQQQVQVSKRFYIHSAPEENDEDFKERHITVGVPKKNYNVVFIKAPARSSHKTAIKISPAVNEEKTVIYVLNKKTDASDVQAEVVEHAQPTTKPEVFFIKYKTNEEAHHAQQQIQAQYDALGGSSQVTDEGVAPVTSVIGSLGGGADGGAGAGGIGGGAIGGGVVDGGLVGGGNGGFIGGSSGAGAIGGGHGAVSHGSNAYLPPNFV